MDRWSKVGAAAAALVMVVGLAGPAAAGGDRRIAAASGVATIHGETYGVSILFEVPSGVPRSDAARDALERIGARPISRAALGSQGFTTTGLVWPTASMTQRYNPANEPSSSALTALRNSQATWNAAPDSRFTFVDGGTTTTCPSLVQECPGSQTVDGHNDVGWLSLSPGTLGVTWYTTSGAPEADMVLSTYYAWSFTCGNVSGRVDAETVFLHENGHALGLGHSSITNTVMYASYSVARCGLAADDREGANYLYPERTGTVTGTVKDQNGNPIGGATVTLGGTSFSGSTNSSGVYAISGVPYPVTYDVRAASGRTSQTTRTTVDQATETVNFTLSIKTKGGGGGGGGGKPGGGSGGSLCDDRPDHPKCR